MVATRHEFHTLHVFIVPSLRILQLPGWSLGEQPLDTFASFIFKSGCSLQRVIITGGLVVEEEEFRRGFPAIPDIDIFPEVGQRRGSV
ncbi:hypothetical protein FB45DRAFT_1067724 [Roridomyces roridus]|uniref:Uncharacterized protein n=1 Tax=Roridomyces roridus TaxID=1738132 RepID=A0AAD7B251_9AGAR|nr:hypothetical protein FB45DRAFT_1067724 [Roridomyces roridus]